MLLGTGYFWDPLARAATAGLLGRLDHGRVAVEELLAQKPDFPERGRVLIEHSIKFEDIGSRILAGLEYCGLEIA